MISSAKQEVSKNNWITNLLVHNNDEIFSKIEFDAAVSAMQKMCDCFLCEKCGDYIGVVLDANRKTTAIKCKCGRFMLAL